MTQKIAAKTAATAAPALSGDLALDALRALPDAILMVDAQNRVAFANDAARQGLQGAGRLKTGVALGDTLGAELSAALGQARQSARAVTFYDVTFAGREAWRVVLMPLDGERVMISAALRPAHHKSATAEKARDALRPVQLMARSWAHEIKNPLAGIQAAAQLLQKTDMAADDRALADLIVNETGRIRRMVDKIDVFNDAEGMAKSFLNIHEVLQPVVLSARAAAGKALQVQESYDPSLPAVFGNADRLAQAVLNVVKNACEAGGDHVLVRSYYDTAAVYHPARHEKLPLAVEVSDNGAGMDPQTRERLFEPYYTTKSEGEGLGLAVVAKVIDDHGGIVDVFEREGRTVFRLLFPHVKGEAS